MKTSNRCWVCKGKKVLHVIRWKDYKYREAEYDRVIPPEELLSCKDLHEVESTYCEDCGLIYKEESVDEWPLYLKERK